MATQARILVITGPGRGKTTSALGIAVRSLSYGKTVLLARFCKAAHSGELTLLAPLPGMTVVGGDCGMTPSPDDPGYHRHVETARNVFERAVTLARDNEVIILDEIIGVIARSMVDEDEVLAFLASLRPEQAAVLTGRDASVRLIAAADTVSDIRCVKHGYEIGIQAQEGIEY